MRVRRNTRPGLDAPDLRLRIVAPRQQVLAGIAPVQGQHPPAMPREIRHLLARLDIVEGDDSCVAAGS